jgi:hypothetical protein
MNVAKLRWWIKIGLAVATLVRLYRTGRRSGWI